MALLYTRTSSAQLLRAATGANVGSLNNNRFVASSCNHICLFRGAEESSRRSSRLAYSIHSLSNNIQSQYDTKRRYMSSIPNHDRFGLGSQKWSTINKSTYHEIVYEAIRNGITTIEAGQEGGDELLASCLRTYLSQLEDQNSDSTLKAPIQILLRIGYRVMTVQENGANKLLFPQDVQLLPQQHDYAEKDDEAVQTTTILHNIHPHYIDHVLQKSDCVQLSKDFPNHVNVVVVLHNPEEQATATSFGGTSSTGINSSYETNQSTISQRLNVSFHKLQELVNTKVITGFGICSNGICLPKDHPLHLSWNDAIVPAVTDATANSNNSSFHVLQLPCNVMERSAFDIANKVKQLQHQQKNQATQPFQNLQLYAVRPLSCYPDLGTGSGYPFLLLDYQLPATMDKVLTWSNEMNQYPQVYDVAYKTALRHFDAQQILDKQAEAIAKGSSAILSVEERETLDGCKLLQSLFHDLDQGLATVRSYQQYEDDLITKIVPLIRDTFESYDDETASVIQSYFGAYSVAVKYAVAKNTRQLVLQQGEKDDSIQNDSTKQEIVDLLTPQKRLQELALQFILDKKDNDDMKINLIDKVMVGCTEPWQIADILKIASSNSKSQ